MSNKQEVIVIGAGISGLACAEYLNLNGGNRFNVTVLESSERIGGRILTMTMDDAKVEIGAAWIHGVGNNPLTKVAHDAGMELGPSGEDCIFVQLSPESARDYLCISPDGKDISKLVTEWQFAFSEFYDNTLVEESIKMQAAGATHDEDVKSALIKAVENSEFKQTWLKKLNGDEKLFKTLLGFSSENLEAFYAANLSKLSLKWIEDQGERDEEDGESIVSGEYETIIRAIAKNVQNIKLQHKVTHVQKQQDGKFKVVTDKGTFPADRVVVSAPLGYLKSGQIKFDPPLPSRKQGAIDRLGFGVLGKVVLKFNEVFWPPKATWIEHISDKGFTAFIYNLYNRIDKPILVVHTSPSVNHKRRSENLTDDQMAQAYLKVLASYFGDVVYKSFVKSYVSDWDVQPHTLGSYSHLALGSSGEDYDVMAEPLLNNQLLFAGEATWREHPASTDGAWLSGQREGKRICVTQTAKASL